MKRPLFRVNATFWLVSALFYLVSHLVLRFYFHDLWKDEWQSWFVVRDMSTIDMLKFLYYEGHPSLWYLYLKPFTLLSEWIRDDILIKVAHALPFIGFVFLISSFRKVPTWLLALFLLGYFPFYEYGLISRGYIFVCLTLFGIVRLHDTSFKYRHWWLASLYFLACQTEVYGLIGAGLLYFYYYIMPTGPSVKVVIKKLSDQEVFTPFLALCLGVLVFYITVNWATDADEVRGRLVNIMSAYDGKTGFAQAFHGIFGRTFFPFSGISSVNNILPISVWSSLALISAGIVLWPFKRLLILFTIYTSLVLFFASTTYSGGLRQWGMAYVFFMVCVFMMDFSLIKKNQSVLLALLLILISHSIYNVIAVRDSIRFPFTNARLTGLYIQSKLPPSAPIVGISPFNTAAASGYADRMFYELPEGVPFTYFRWLEKVYYPPEEELRLFAAYKKASVLYVITHEPISPDRYPSLRLVKAFDSFSLKNENFYIYQLI